MTLFILFVLFFTVFAQNNAVYPVDPKENYKIPEHNSKNQHVPHCTTYTETNGIQTACQKCQSEFQLDTNQCNVSSSADKGPVSADTTNNKFNHSQIGWDFKNGTCDSTKKVQIVDASGHKITNDKYSNTPCLACAKYASDGTCERCAAGYLENKGNCYPLSLNPFQNSDVTNKNCVYGKQTEGNTTCIGCTGFYKINDGLCVPASNSESFPQGCVRKYFNAPDNKIECLECEEGYFLKGKVCVQSHNSKHLCKAIDDKQQCAQCIPGYYLNQGSCLKCDVKLPFGNLFTGDECNIYSNNKCDCNPNCIRDPVIYDVCSSRHCDMFSETETVKIDGKNYPKCLRCEQGYKINKTDDKHGCIPCENDCFTDSSKTKCESGYYIANDENNEISTGVYASACRKCEGKCIECTSKRQCVEGQMNIKNAFYGHALNGLPCLDSKCSLCSSDDPTVCYKCNNGSVLIGGKCYISYEPNTQANGATDFYDVCRYYKNSDFITNRNAVYDYKNSYLYHAEPAYLRESINKIDNTYLCQPTDFLPNYYRYYDKTLSCAGEHRDIYNDCECESGYYSLNNSKVSNCLPTKIKYCVKAISDVECVKCREGMVLKNNGSVNDPDLYCGCPHDNQRMNHLGFCVSCPSSCETCKTVELGNNKYHTQCDKCLGRVDKSSENLINLNYNRNMTNHCKCNEGHIAYNSTNSSEIYSCFEKPSGCLKDNNYKAEEYSISCLKCDKEGFSLSSSCSACDIGYYEELNDKGEIVKCNKCPYAYNNVSYCLTCNAKQCLTCIDENLDPEKNCTVCKTKQYYSLIYVKDGNLDNNNAAVNKDIEKLIGSEPLPKCIYCGEDCKLTSTTGCFLGESANHLNLSGAEKDSKNKVYYDKYKQYGRDHANVSFLYTKEMLESITNHTYCDACFGDISQQDPSKDCSCRNDNYLYLGQCHICKEELGKQNFTSLKADGTEGVFHYNDVCKLEYTGNESGDVLCEREITGVLKCKKCLNNERNPATNCRTCKNITYYPVFKDNQHKCEACNKKCASCDNSVNCTGCVATGATGVDCNNCLKGYYKEGSGEYGAKCKKCPLDCSACTGPNSCTECKEDNNIPGPNKDCKACAEKFYYNPVINECSPVTTTNGFAESTIVCKNTTTNLTVTCAPGLNTSQIVFEERATKCDPSIGVGISENPVNGTCVCDVGYLDKRNKTEIEKDSLPQCTSVKDILKDPFCLDAKFTDEAKTKAVCERCNADYLELVNGKCKCKKTHYTTGWGMCVPCGRHNKGCQECDGKYHCTKCDESAYKMGSEEKDKDGKLVRKCVGK